MNLIWAHKCVMIRSMFRHSSPWCHLHALRYQPKLNSQWIGVCQHSQHGTVMILNDYYTTVKITIRILSLWGDNVYGYEWFLTARCVEKRITKIGVCIQISQISEPDQSFCGFSYTNTLHATSHSLFLDNLDYTGRSVKNQRVIHRSTQRFIDW